MGEQAAALRRPQMLWAGTGFYADAWRRLRRHRSAIVGLVIVGALASAAVFAPVIAPADPITQDLGARLLPPSQRHWLGTDDLGRDLLTRLVFGGRVSLTVGIVSVGIALAAGSLLGLLGGFYGGGGGNLHNRAKGGVAGVPPYLSGTFLIGLPGTRPYNHAAVI